MKKYVQYLSYIVRHKYYVGKECFKVGLYWRGLKHDISKLMPREFFPYTDHFYNNKSRIRDKTGYYDPLMQPDAFKVAWLHHQSLNDHHWQYWVLPNDVHDITFIPMSDDAILEMICDWMGAAQAQGKSREDVVNWYDVNKNKLRMHFKSREKVEALLNEMFGYKSADRKVIQ